MQRTAETKDRHLLFDPAARDSNLQWYYQARVLGSSFSVNGITVAFNVAYSAATNHDLSHGQSPSLNGPDSSRGPTMPTSYRPSWPHRAVRSASYASTDRE